VLHYLTKVIENYEQQTEEPHRHRKFEFHEIGPNPPRFWQAEKPIAFFFQTSPILVKDFPSSLKA
jgi:hypothetical protein